MLTTTGERFQLEVPISATNFQRHDQSYVKQNIVRVLEEGLRDSGVQHHQLNGHPPRGSEEMLIEYLEANPS